MIQMRNLHPQLQAAIRNGGFGSAYPTVKPLYVNASHPAAGDDAPGTDPNSPFATIQAAIDAAAALSIVGQTIYIAAKDIPNGDTDPASYTESIIIPVNTPLMRLIGYGNGVAQGAQPQIKVGTTTTNPIITIRAPGVLISNLSINGAGATGGGVLLDDDASTKTAFGTVIEDCFFKNCVGSAAAATGGAIMWSAAGGAWQVRISRCHFYGNRGGIVLKGTSSSRPTDVRIEDCTFASSVNTDIDCDIYLPGDGVQGLIIDRCEFATVDVPAYATSPSAARYMDLTGCEGIVSNCTFACISDGTSAKTFKSNGDAAKIPATVRIVHCWGEGANDSTHSGGIERVS